MREDLYEKIDSKANDKIVKKQLKKLEDGHQSLDRHFTN